MILKTLNTFLKNYPKAPLVIAYSGGVDSQVLLHAVAQLKRQNILKQNVIAIHVNHGLSPFAKQWQNFALHQCEQLNIQFKTVNVKVLEKPRTSLEAQARDKRYQALEELSPKNAVILTGHHQDDQVETFFLSLKRGSGLKGLSAMGIESEFGCKNQRLLRPLLNVSREGIVHYAQEHQLKWIEDESNTDTRFDRNFLRKEILPKLKARWSNFNQTVTRSAQHCQEAQQILDEVAEQDLEHCLVEKSVLAIPALMALSLARFNQTVRFFIHQHKSLMPTQQQLEQLYEQLSEAGKDKTPEVKLGDVWLRRFQDKLYLTSEYQAVKEWQYEIDLDKNNQTIELPDRLGKLILYLDQEKIIDSHEVPDNSARYKLDSDIDEKSITSLSLPNNIQSIKLAFSHENPKCLPDYRRQSRSLKKVLQELSIPPWQRKRLPLLFINNELVAVIGYFVCQPFIADKHQNKIIVHWLKESG
jgi:tRNA(Ile)-lysidine synthase